MGTRVMRHDDWIGQTNKMLTCGYCQRGSCVVSKGINHVKQRLLDLLKIHSGHIIMMKRYSEDN